MWRHRVIAALLGMAGVGTALACGPNFPWQLLDDRAKALSYPAGLGFSSEVARLVPPPKDELRPVEDFWWAERGRDVLEAEKVEAEKNRWNKAALAAARAAASDEQALAVGRELPRGVVEYIAGAIEFRAGRLDSARRHFEAIAALPPEEAQPRRLAATYMLGRILQQEGRLAEARAAYQAVRADALSGLPDSWGVAVSSLGQEARLDLLEAGFLRTDWPFPIPPVNEAAADRLIAHGIQLYAEQASRGSRTGMDSLRLALSWVAADPDVLARAVEAPLVRRLLVAYVINSSGPSYWEIDDAPSDAFEPVLDAILARPETPMGDDIDRLAVLAYRAGRYDDAERLTQKAARPLGLWVRGKLAIRRGDREAAARDWRAAAAAADQASSNMDTASEKLMRGEAAVAALTNGEYVEALRLLMPAADRYWGDVTYIAERVLTIDELKAFVDGLPVDERPMSPEAARYWFLGDQNPTMKLRALLARRLMRAGQVDAALPYFPSPARTMAATYRDAAEAARPTWRWRNISRAEALFRVAMITRRQGMELMGTEGPPDSAALEGSFEYGVGQPTPWGHRNPDDPAVSHLVLPTEIARSAAGAPTPDTRFHYRVLAADRALEAAALLPQGSQAYAATLCWASRFAIDSRDQPRAWSIYELYVATGPYQAWATAFGRTCPEPDFTAARDYWPKRIVREARRHPLLAITGLAMALLLAGSFFAFQRGWARRTKPMRGQADVTS
jgi:hypothetical protein